MHRPAAEEFSRSVPMETIASVRGASASKTEARSIALSASFDDPEAARAEAAEIKSRVLHQLGALLVELETQCIANGIQVHWASDAAEARSIIIEICQGACKENRTVVKAKSMATEEIHLNRALEEVGLSPVETDLGEYVVQLDHDTPSHIVTPIIHKSKSEVARTFEREGLGPYTEDPNQLTMQARDRLRSKFKEARVGISGVNFAIAETGRIVLVENEGNNRFSTTAVDVHIALMGIEKILPRERDLPLFLKLLAGSATGQRMTTYVHLITGPRRDDEPDGPRAVHLVLLDNGRSKLLAGPYRDILRCIRCGACLNVCPVYRQATGHAYGHVYSGPLGAVLAPALEGVDVRGDLPSASSLCGACEEVCPVKIPIPDMLLRLRDETYRRGARQPIAWGMYEDAARSPMKWRTALTLLPMAAQLPSPIKSAWTEFREMPRPKGRDFRKWWNDRSK